MRQLHVSMSEKEQAELKRDAYRHEMNVSEYIRWLVHRERKENEQ